MNALYYPGAPSCTVDGLNGWCGFLGDHELSALLGDSYVPNDTEVPADVAFFLSNLDPERPVGFVEHSLNAPQIFAGHKGVAFGTFAQADSYPLSGEPIPWLLYRDPQAPDVIIERWSDNSVGVGPGKSLATKVALVKSYYAVPDVPSACAVLNDSCEK